MPPTSLPFTTAANVVLGTPGYMSPEHADGIAPPDHHCDLWGLATVAYEALTGELPVLGAQPDELIANLRARSFVPVHQRNPALPPALDAFFERAFASHVKDRYASARELAAAFERAVTEPMRSDAPIALDLASPLEPPQSARSWRSRVAHQRWVRIVLAGGGCILAGALCLAAARGRRTPGAASGPASVAPTTEVGSAAERRIEPAQPTVLATGIAVTVQPTVPPAVPSMSGAAPVAPLMPLQAAPIAALQPAAPRPRVRSDCAVPYTYDAQGIKRWKRTCL